MYRLLPLLLFPTLALAQTTAGGEVILRTDGEEIPGRVLAISPREVAYLPLTSTDTLRLSAAEVFLIRYANGTRELLHPATGSPAAPAPPANPLLGLDADGRTALGRTDALRCYQGTGGYSGAVACTLFGTPLGGALGAAIISSAPVQRNQLKAPDPALLSDWYYAAGYQQQANATKRRRTWAGFGTVVLVDAVAAALLAAAMGQ